MSNNDKYCLIKLAASKSEQIIVEAAKREGLRLLNRYEKQLAKGKRLNAEDAAILVALQAVDDANPIEVNRIATQWAEQSVHVLIDMCALIKDIPEDVKIKDVLKPLWATLPQHHEIKRRVASHPMVCVRDWASKYGNPSEPLALGHDARAFISLYGR